MEPRVVTLAEEPHWAQQVIDWHMDEWMAGWGWPRSRVADYVLATTQHGAAETIFVLVDGDLPVGTAGLAVDDLPSRLDLTPWLAALFVAPAARGRGHATRLIRAVESLARAQGAGTLWLFTWSTVELYERLGWRCSNIERHEGCDVVLMARDLIGARQPAPDGR